MAVGIILLLLLIVVAPITLSIVALVKATGTRRRLEDLEKRHDYQEMAWAKLRRDVDQQQPAPMPTPEPVTTAPPPPAASAVVPPPLISPPPPVVQRPGPTIQDLPRRTPAPQPTQPAINWEQFMGAKMFA